MPLESTSASFLLKSSSSQSGAWKNNFRKAIDQNWKCHMVFTPLASLPSGTDLKRISKNDGFKAESSHATTGSQ
jgi:hypothetical protein